MSTKDTPQAIELQEKITRLEALRDRVRAADGPDRKLDGEIWATLELKHALKSYWQAASGMPKPIDSIPREGIGWLNVMSAAPKSSHSIDAAIALVERVLPDVDVGMWTRHLNKTPRAMIFTGAPKSDIIRDGATLPLAILDALLTALIEQERG